MLYEVHRNFGPKEGMMSGMKKILGQSSKGKGDFISSSKAFNKRAQIWFTNSIGGDAKFIGENLKNNDLYVPEDMPETSSRSFKKPAGSKPSLIISLRWVMDFF